MASRFNNSEGAPPSYGLIRMYYRHSLRPLLLGFTLFSFIAGALWCASSFENKDNDSRINPKIWTYDIVFGSIFAALSAIELFGLIAVWRQRVSLMTIYSLLSVVSALAVIVLEILSIVIDFMFKNDMITECTKEVTTSNSEDCFGYWCSDRNKTQDDGNRHCHHLWTTSVFGDFVWFFIVLFCSTLFSYMAFSYLHELRNVGRPLDPQRYAMQDHPVGYDGLDYQYAPPSGPPPPIHSQSSNPYDSASKPPDYDPTLEGYTYEPDAKM